jgi:hypothetical protein
MGFYIRKGIQVGPFRFNLSRSGLGISVGVKGFRVGTGPRGSYIHMGRGGIYYRKSLSPSKKPYREEIYPQVVPETPKPPFTNLPERAVGSILLVESLPVEKMTDLSENDLLSEMNEKMKKTRFFPWVSIILLGGIFYLLTQNLPGWVILSSTLSALGVSLYTWMKDEVRRKTVLLYHLDKEVESAYREVHSSFLALASCKKVWHVEGWGELLNRKYFGGAKGAILRKEISLTIGSPPFVKTNLKVPLIPVGKQTLAFFPDRLFVFEPNKVGAIPYENLHIQVEEIPFAEEMKVPADGTVVGKTWRYTNEDGSPDMRFRENYEIPILAYEKVHFSSPTGLNEIIVVSRKGAGVSFKEAVDRLGRVHRG